MTKTKQIFNLSAPYNNQYQGDFTRLVFVCSVGMLRSPTAAEVATENGYNARSCGSDEVALIPLSANLIMWADKIVFMHRDNLLQSLETFKNTGYEDDIKAKSLVLNVDDDYNFAAPGLRIIVQHWLNEMRTKGVLNPIKG